MASLLTGRGYQRIQFVPQATLRAVFQPGERSFGGGGRAGGQIRRQRFRQRIVDEETPGRVRPGVRLQGQLQSEAPVELIEMGGVADEQKTRAVLRRLRGQRFERHFRADARHVAQ